MFDFIFCPQCGGRLGSKIIGDEGEVPFCELCKQPYFKQFPTCVIITVVNEDKKVILLKQNYVSETSHVLVAGYIKFGDTADETVAKEVAEETGQKVNKTKYLRSYFYEKSGMLMLGYIVFVNTKEIVKSSEVDEAEWFDFDTALTLVRKGSTADKHLLSSIEYMRRYRK